MSDDDLTAAVRDALDPTPASEADWPVSRRDTLRALAGVGALAVGPGGAQGAAGTGIADEAYFSNYGWESTAEGGVLTIDGAEFTFDGSETIGLPDGGQGTELVTPSGASASEVVGPGGEVVFEGEIPDSDLTQYSLTDPDGRITVVDSSTYEARLPNGTNESARLYKNISLSNYSHLVYSYDFEMLSHTKNAHYHIGAWSDTEDTTDGTNQTAVGGTVGSIDGNLAFGTLLRDGSTYDRTIISNINEDTEYHVDIEYDLGTDTLTVTLSQGGSQIGQETETIPSASYNWHYAGQSRSAGFSNEGSMDVDVRNVSFEAV